MMSNYPDGMTRADMDHVEGVSHDRECPDCGTSVPIGDQEWDDECPVCERRLPSLFQEEDPDAKADRRREEGG